jgi:hypothetical protein
MHRSVRNTQEDDMEPLDNLETRARHQELFVKRDKLIARLVVFFSLLLYLFFSEDFFKKWMSLVERRIG